MAEKRAAAKVSRAPGQVAGPAVLFALLSLILAAGFDRAGLLEGPEAWIRESYERFGFKSLDPIDAEIVWLVSGLAALGLVLAVLASPGLWRRVVLGASALVVAAAWSPVLALTGFYLPIVPLLFALIWSWVCAATYAQRHRMPCDAIPATAGGREATSPRRRRQSAKLSSPVEHGESGLP